MRALSWLRRPGPTASPPESSRSAGGRSDTHRRLASSSDSFAHSAARAGAGVRHAARALRRGVAAGLLALPLLAGLPDGAAAQTAPECSTANADGSYTVPTGWTLKPSGLAAGDTFRLLFVTQTLRSASATDIATYNTFVQTNAKAGHSQISDSCGNLFKVVGSTATVDARDNIDAESTDTDAAIYWLNGAKVADNYAGFWDGSWDSTEVRRPDGTTDTTTMSVATGSNSDGTKNSSEYLGANLVKTGNPRQSSRNPIRDGATLGSGNTRFYGMSPVFKVEDTRPVLTISTNTPTITEGGGAQFGISASPALPDGTVVRWRVDSADPHSSPRVWYVHEAFRNTTQIHTVDTSVPDEDGTYVNASVATNDNDIIEASTYITVTLLPGTGYRVGKSSVAKVWVEDNDEPHLCGKPTPVPTHRADGTALTAAERNAIKNAVMSATTFEFSESSFSAPGAGKATVTAKRTGTAAASVNYETGDGSLKAASGDYVSTSGTLRWAAGDGGTKSFTVPVANSSGTFRVYLSNASSGAGACDYAQKQPPGGPVPGGSVVWVTRTTPPGIPVIAAEQQFYSVGEGDGTVTLWVRKFGGGRATVDYATFPSGAAVSPGDFTSTSGTLTFPAGEEFSRQSITVTITDDEVQESDELFVVSLSNASGEVRPFSNPGGTATIDALFSAPLVTIKDNDQPRPPVIGFAHPAQTVYEGDGTASLTVTKTGATTGNVTVQYATADGSATAPGDYTDTSGTLTFGPSETEKTIEVPLVDDGVAEETETFRVILSNPGSATLGTSETWLLLDDGNAPPRLGQSLPPPVTVTISADATSVTEGGDVIFTVTASPAPQADLTVSVSADQEMGGEHGVASSELGTVTVKAGETSATWTVTAMSDSVERADGTLKGSIVAGDGYTRGTPHEVTLTLLDDDAPPKGQISTTTPAVTIPADLIAGVRDLAGQTHHGQAHVNRWKRVLMAFGLEDYAGLTATTAAESKANEDKFSSPLWPRITAVLEKLEAAALPVVTVAAGAGVTEGGDAVFTLTASPAPASSLPVSVTVSASGDWGVTTGSATATFAAGASTTTVTLPTTDDQADEADGSITVTVGTGTGYTVGSASSASVAVADNDDAPATPLPVVTVSASPDVTEGGNVAFSLSASPAPAAAMSVSVTVAVDGDWGVTAGTHTVSVGTNGHGALRFATTDDDVDEPDGSITATLNDGDGYTVGSAATATVAVADNDLPLPVVTVTAGAGVTEGGNAVFTFTADRAPAASFQASVTVSEAGGGDHVGADNEGGHSVTFPKGVTTATLEIATTDDGVNEPDGTVTATLNDGTGYEVGTPSTGTVAVADDDVPEITVAAGADVTEGGDAAFTFTASPVPYADLPVSVTVAANGDWGVTAGSHTVTIPTSGSATLTLTTTDDGTDEPDGSLTATVDSGSGYTVGAASSASVAVADDDDAPVNNLPALYVDDATKAEGEGLPVMEFTVRLSPASQAPVSVHVSTKPSEPVSAEPKVDYMPGKYDLTFRPGDTERQVYIWIHDDSHNEDPETFRVVLSKVTGATIGDGVAVGTITNDDPLPGAWLARFGRTVAEQALDGIAARMAAPRTPGMQGTLAGQALDFGAPSAAGSAQGDPAAHALSDVAQAFGGHPVGPVSGLGEPAAQSHTLTGRDALLASRFSLTGEEDVGGGSFAFWGWASQGYFDGTERGDGTDVALDGTVTTGMLGADYARGKWLTGLALMQSQADGGYTGDCRPEADGASPCNGDVEASLTAAVPYASIEASPRLRIWTALGYGTGDVTLRTAMGERLEAGTDWQMAALGLRGDVFAPSAGGGPGLALTSDALWTGTQSEAMQGLSSSDSSVTRLRLGLEGSWAVSLSGLGTLTPKLEMGLRRDGGDVETGFGVELGGGIAWLAPGYGLSLSLEGRTLVAHETDLEDSGVSVSLSFDPNPASARGPSVSLRQSVGGQATGGVAALFGSQALVRRTGTGEMGGLWSAEASWGFAAFGGRFTGSPHVGYALSDVTRDYTLGWRLEPTASAVSFGVAASQREHDGAATEHVVGLEVRSGW